VIPLPRRAVMRPARQGQGHHPLRKPLCAARGHPPAVLPQQRAHDRDVARPSPHQHIPNSEAGPDMALGIGEPARGRIERQATTMEGGLVRGEGREEWQDCKQNGRPPNGSPRHSYQAHRRWSGRWRERGLPRPIPAEVDPPACATLRLSWPPYRRVRVGANVLAYAGLTRTLGAERLPVHRRRMETGVLSR